MKKQAGDGKILKAVPEGIMFCSQMLIYLYLLCWRNWFLNGAFPKTIKSFWHPKQNIDMQHNSLYVYSELNHIEFYERSKSYACHAPCSTAAPKLQDLHKDL